MCTRVAIDGGAKCDNPRLVTLFLIRDPLVVSVDSQMLDFRLSPSVVHPEELGTRVVEDDVLA